MPERWVPVAPEDIRVGDTLRFVNDPRWLGEHGPANFKEDMGSTYFEGACLDRIDNDRGYWPDNCQWMTLSDHSKKTMAERKRLGKLTLPDGRFCTDVARENGVNWNTAYSRMGRGWDPYRACTEPADDLLGIEGP